MTVENDAKKIELADKIHDLGVKSGELQVMQKAIQVSDAYKAIQAKQKEMQDLQKAIKELQVEAYGA